MVNYELEGKKKSLPVFSCLADLRILVLRAGLRSDQSVTELEFPSLLLEAAHLLYFYALLPFILILLLQYPSPSMVRLSRCSISRESQAGLATARLVLDREPLQQDVQDVLVGPCAKSATKHS